MVLPSGTAEVDAENENSRGDPAAGSCVVKVHVAGVAVKPFPETLPVPATAKNPCPCESIAEFVKLKVKLSTDQKLGIAPELNGQVGAKVVSSNTLTKVAKLPSRLCTCGLSAGPGPCQAVTMVAVFTVG